MKHTIELYKYGKYYINSPNNMDIDGHNVQRQTKQGRTLLICDCTNHTKFCNESPLCEHKKFFILFPLLELISEKAREISMYYKVAKDLSKTQEAKEISNQAINDFNKFKEIDFR